MANGPSGIMVARGAELVIGLVTPIGTNTGLVAERICSALSKYNYRSRVIKVTDYLSSKGPPGEFENERVDRLIKAGDAWCRSSNTDAAMAVIAVNAIRATRRQIHERGGSDETPEALLGRPVPRYAYIIHSLKRPAEVSMLRAIYGPQFVLLGCQASREDRLQNLMDRSLSDTTEDGRKAIALELMEKDASEAEDMGQKVNTTFPQADYFLRSDDPADRFVDLLFGSPKIAPEPSEFAMYLALATSVQSLTSSRRVGASLLRGRSVIALGYNEVPPAESPDILSGEDVSEVFKLDLLKDTLTRLQKQDIVSKELSLDSKRVGEIARSFKGSQLMSVIEYQRAIHAEMAAIGDAAKRGQAIEGADLYCTTYPCHLCFKDALAAGINRIYYIDPYPKSRSAEMFPVNAHRLIPYEGVSTRMYMRVFNRELPQPDERGNFPVFDSGNAQPVLAEGSHAPETIADLETRILEKYGKEH